MTSVLSRYLVRGLFGGCVLLLLTLVALFSVFALIEEVDDVGKGAYTILDALAVVALNAPTLALEMAPFAAMLGTVYGLAQFIRSNELLAVRVAGFSPAWVMFRCAVAAVLFAGVLVGVEMASRPLGKDAITYRLSKLQPDGELLARSGYWYRQGDKFVNVASYRRDTEPRGILQFEFDGIELKQSLFARSATARQGEEWALDEVVQNRLDSMARVERSTQATLAWQPPWGALDEVLNFPIVSLTSEELYKATRRHAPEEVLLERTELARRLSLPLVVLALSLFAAPILLLRTERGGLGAKVTGGILGMLSLIILQQILVNALLLAGVPPELGVPLPAALTLLGALGLLMVVR